jgi:hypothetical protein
MIETACPDDVVIVGGGVSGLAVTIHLLERIKQERISNQ